MEWINVSDDLPEADEHVFIALGIPGQELDYRDAKYRNKGFFDIRNGAYSDSSVMAYGWDCNQHNATRVMAWCKITKPTSTT